VQCANTHTPRLCAFKASAPNLRTRCAISPVLARVNAQPRGTCVNPVVCAAVSGALPRDWRELPPLYGFSFSLQVAELESKLARQDEKHRDFTGGLHKEIQRLQHVCGGALP
jgi:hypothetical protein